MPFRYDLPSDDDSEAMHRLRRLAEILQCEPEAFFRNTADFARPDQNAQLWRLWQAIDSEDKREQVLGLMRAIVGVADGQPPGGAGLS